jgi:hypothetical protein
MQSPIAKTNNIEVPTTPTTPFQKRWWQEKWAARNAERDFRAHNPDLVKMEKDLVALWWRNTPNAGIYLESVRNMFKMQIRDSDDEIGNIKMYINYNNK